MAALALPTPTKLNLILPSGSGTPTKPTTSIPSARRRSSVALVKQRNSSPLIELRSDHDDDDEDEESEAEEVVSKKKRRRGGGEGKAEYKYSSEIAQMMFVFGEVQDPLPETTHLVEDIVRGQIVEIITRARSLTNLRGSRFLSAEDIIFLIRDDRSKVNRLRTYLSWKDVRKKAKEDEGNGRGDGLDVEVDIDDMNDKAGFKARKAMVKLPWELFTPFTEFLRSLPSRQNRPDEDDETDEDEMQAYEDSMQRLREADEATKKMTKDEYVHYSDCRQASFTYRKAKRFRDFVNFSAYLDVRPNDDIVDILGFLSFEMVRALCVNALEVRAYLKRSRSGGPSRPVPNRSPTKRKTTISSGGSGPLTNGAKEGLSEIVESPNSQSPEDATGAAAAAIVSSIGSATSLPPVRSRNRTQPSALFAAPPSEKQPLLPSHVLEAFATMQRRQDSVRCGVLGTFRGRKGKGRIALV